MPRLLPALERVAGVHPRAECLRCITSGASVVGMYNPTQSGASAHDAPVTAPTHEPRFVTNTGRFPSDDPIDVWIGDTVTGEFRPLYAFTPGDAPAEISDRETLAAEIVARMNQHRDSLPEYWDHDRSAFVYENGEPA